MQLVCLYNKTLFSLTKDKTDEGTTQAEQGRNGRVARFFFSGTQEGGVHYYPHLCSAFRDFLFLCLCCK